MDGDFLVHGDPEIWKTAYAYDGMNLINSITMPKSFWSCNPYHSFCRDVSGTPGDNQYLVDFGDDLLKGHDIFMPPLFSDYEESNDLMTGLVSNTKDSVITSDSLKDAVPVDLKALDLNNLRNHEIKPGTTSVSKDAKNVTLDSKTITLQNNPVVFDNAFKLRPIINKKYEDKEENRKMVNSIEGSERKLKIADLASSRNIQSPMPESRDLDNAYISHPLNEIKRSKHENEQLKIAKSDIATKAKRKKPKVEQVSALIPTSKNIKINNLIESDSESQRKAFAKHISIGKENWPPKKNKKKIVNMGCEIKQAKGKRCSVVRTPNDLIKYTVGNSAMNACEIHSSKESQEKKHHQRSANKNSGSNLACGSEVKKSLRRERNRIHSRNHRIKKKMQFQTLAEDNHRLQILHKAMRTQYEKFLAQLKVTTELLMKETRNNKNVTHLKTAHDTARKLRTEIGIQIECLRNQYNV
ncbi:uncharacterized protein TRIADDRAFT_59789 [Trichoplax adhaerens]|uniref:BZIP domain-containing protein n=1 Tax=Trichoplax adhaerens TaxID=10228 RepID=B3S6F7_TRIAD|nr:hypothetical protein TRIADDRAFT_59789 [Trichoplax adhaerens]EDV21613.1 hypothetical protein TRIADDRAFT_59789 [Trichoplax adhaerens]|eukprot:XP_002115761.1 hypothetical protein TRIADDRAFT_59789 [Trichoplax adhaerens]